LNLFPDDETPKELVETSFKSPLNNEFSPLENGSQREFSRKF
jgi:hypothetical protein